jgi:RNA polymerase sigma factor (TIGR02999 family)
MTILKAMPNASSCSVLSLSVRQITATSGLWLLSQSTRIASVGSSPERRRRQHWLNRRILFLLSTAHTCYGNFVNDITRALRAMETGDPQATELLLSLVYDELRRLAAAKMARERPGHTLQPTALVHEAWLRLGGDAQPAWENRRHFFGAAAEAMRRVLIGNARRKHAARRGVDVQHVDINAPEIEIATPIPDEELLRMHDALDCLATEDPRKAELVKLRYFAGLSIEEAAAALGISDRTAKRDWTYARAWLGEAIERMRENE